jgi:hypothetical protein
MNLIIVGQYADILLATFLVLRLVGLGLQWKYRAFLIFVAYDSLQSIFVVAYAALNAERLLDYRFLYFGMTTIAMATSIWMVYALVTALLGRLPGILRFSRRLLNGLFLVCVSLGLVTIFPQYNSSQWARSGDWRARLTLLFLTTQRTVALAELAIICSIIVFVLFFPIQVPRNLAAFGVGLSIYLSLKIGSLLLQAYMPSFFASAGLYNAGGLLTAGCMIYWIFAINPAGESADATLGRRWDSVPKEDLVRQLEAMNGALLRSR